VLVLAVGAAVASAANAAEPAAKRILCFGDDNTLAPQVAPADRWPNRLQALLGNVEVINSSAEGRTVGQGTGELNGLEQVEAALKAAAPVDEVIVMLGTIDVQAHLWQEGGGPDGFGARLERLMAKIQGYRPGGAAPPSLTLVTPPPIGSKLEDRYNTQTMYMGANQRIATLLPRYHILTIAHRTRVVNVFATLLQDIDKLVTADGVHLNAEGQKRVAQAVADVLKDTQAPGPPKDVVLAVETRFSLDATKSWDTTLMAWAPSPSEDVIGYEILNQRGALIAMANSNSAQVNGRWANLSVRARDAAGNVGDPVKATPQPGD
jgi:lysophospholipase L1-like esterase